ncbi:hypothetical protein KAI52_00595 [Candidatus Parcubacteria bacterium]|nr:hypothetical protein [Candidatus Parcubacteria bacterium]
MILATLIMVASYMVIALTFILPNATTYPVPDLFKTVVGYGVNLISIGTIMFSPAAWYSFLSIVFTLFLAIQTWHILIWIYGKIPFMGK